MSLENSSPSKGKEGCALEVLEATFDLIEEYGLILDLVSWDSNNSDNDSDNGSDDDIDDDDEEGYSTTMVNNVTWATGEELQEGLVPEFEAIPEKPE